jgi:putative PIN family toxin of toxin-antitoxin system
VKTYKAIIDTNVLYSGLFSANGASFRILQLIDSGKIVPYLSTSLIFEYEEILKRNQRKLRLSLNDIEEVLNAICNRGEQRIIHFLWRPQLPDPKDDHILELAVACHGADIVTHNIKDFNRASLFGIRVLKPSFILKEIV